MNDSVTKTDFQKLVTEFGFSGDIDVSDKSRDTYSHDASLFQITPQVIVFPKNARDVGAVVQFVNKYNEESKRNKQDDSNTTLSITPRSAGTDMSGGAIGSSIIMDFTKYMFAIKKVTEDYSIVEPGCYYRDFDTATRAIDRIMPTYTASRDICAVGGMVANNAGGEKSIKYGKTENWIKELKVVFADGKEYVVRPLTAVELDAKANLYDFEGEIYRKLWKLIHDNLDEIMSAKPQVSKNSAGYYLWNVYDQATGTFDLCRLIVGSQGTLGIVTEITFKLTPTEKYSNILAVFLPDINQASQLVNEILPFKPESLETYDDYSMKLAVKFFFDFYKRLGFWKFLRLGLQFIPEGLMMIRGGMPKLILMIECSGSDENEVHERLEKIAAKIAHFGYKEHIAKSQIEAEKYWRIRRESFNLLRKHVHGMRTAPFIDDIIVNPEYLPDFMPKLQEIMSEYKLVYTLAGHLGNGNFHIIPLMDLKSPYSADIILELSHKVYDLVLQYHGSITAEHNDGIIRTPYLAQMYGPAITELFKETKQIFDPNNIFNPGKKVGGTFEDIKKNLAK